MEDSAQVTDYEREVRLAVVMYGGISLAIYINGIAQELLGLVRATAPGVTMNDLQGSERVYRKMAWLMANEGKGVADYPQEDALPPTRFLIDVISGTSAGGINGIFLAKALANGQDMQGLKDLWVNEGNIELLINDKKSRDKGMPLRNPPESLLNGQRMYAKLLEAFSGMDKQADKAGSTNGASPYIEELDLFVTTTDIQGIPLPIRLADKVVYERRHRNVFHFSYSESSGLPSGEARNDFRRENNPFLAFSARCTSSFPFAFEPMKLTDIYEVLKLYPEYQGGNSDSVPDSWKSFYREYQDVPKPGRTPVPFPSRSFGDGGYLDNKPFTYAIEALTTRQAEVPVDRKLIYIEPSPEHPELELEKAQRPDVLQNVAASLLTLPRYETIREDLQRVLERNRLIARIDRINKDLTRYVKYDGADDSPYIRDEVWADLSFAELIKLRGRSYMAYHRLLIASITDDLAETITRVIGFDEKSDYLVAIRCLVRAWRETSFCENPEPSLGLKSLNAFVLGYDLCYPLRQVAMLREKLDAEYKSRKDSRDQLREAKTLVNKAWTRLRNLRKLLRSPRRSPLLCYLAQSPLTAADLDYVLGCDDPRSEEVSRDQVELTGMALERCEARAEDLLNMQSPEVKEFFAKMAAEINSRIVGAVKEANSDCLKALGLDQVPEDPRSWEKDSAEYCYLNFDLYDMITFPILYETGMGEIDNVEVIRISPEDAVSLIDERKSGCRKLAGTALGHFGAFMERRWRESDIMWGRLDGAERLIRAMLPGHQDLELLIGEAQAAIVCETLESADRVPRMGAADKCALLTESMMRPKDGIADSLNLSSFIQSLKKNAGAALPDVERLISEETLLQHYSDAFKTQSRLNPEAALCSAARATIVVGSMLDGLTENRRRGKKLSSYLLRVARIFWGLVELSVPHSFSNLLLRHWLFMVYLVALVLILGGLIPGGTSVLKYGLALFVVTLLLDLLCLFFSGVMTGRGWRDAIAQRLRLITGWQPLAKAAGLLLLTAMSAEAIVHWQLCWAVLKADAERFVLALMSLLPW